MSITRITAAAGIAWHTVNSAVLKTGWQRLIDDPFRVEGVEVICVDEHVRRHAPGGGRYVIVIIDLTPIRYGTVNSLAVVQRPFLELSSGQSKWCFGSHLLARRGSGIDLEAAAGKDIEPEEPTTFDSFIGLFGRDRTDAPNRGLVDLHLHLRRAGFGPRRGTFR